MGTPNEARGTSLLQLDGVDGSLNLVADGLFGVSGNDFTAQGAFALRVLIESDLPGFIDFKLYSGSAGALCSLRVDVPGDDQLSEYILPYSSFTTGCTLSNIGAVEIEIDMDDNIDVLIEDFSTWGPVQTCQCVCPAFTCGQVIRDLDDDIFSYYATSQFGVFNPTTDFSTLYTPGDTNSFSSFTSLFSSGFTSFFTSFTSFFTFTSFFSSFTSFSSSFSFSSFSRSSSSSSGAVELAAVTFVSFAVVALF